MRIRFRALPAPRGGRPGCLRGGCLRSWPPPSTPARKPSPYRPAQAMQGICRYTTAVIGTGPQSMIRNSPPQRTARTISVRRMLPLAFKSRCLKRAWHGPSHFRPMPQRWFLALRSPQPTLPFDTVPRCHRRSYSSASLACCSDPRRPQAPLARESRADVGEDVPGTLADPGTD